MGSLCFIIIYIIICFICLGNVHSIKSNIIALDENNWRDCLEGEWMIKFYAPWCPACKANDVDFKEFAEWSDELNIKVGTVDITKHPGLSGRFMVTALPTFYHGKDGVFRRYTGDRSASSMEDYVESMAWKNAEPISWLRHPNSIQMTVMSWLFKTSIVMKTIHETITETYGFSSWISYVVFGVGTLITGLTLGLLLVCIIDIVYPPKPLYPPVPKTEKSEKEQKEKEKEEDGEISETNITDVESDASQGEDELTQKSSRLSQGWETIKDLEIEESQDENKSQLRKRKSDKDTGEEAGDSQNKTTE